MINLMIVTISSLSHYKRKFYKVFWLYNFLELNKTWIYWFLFLLKIIFFHLILVFSKTFACFQREFMRTYKFYLQVDTLFFLIISHIDFDGVPSKKSRDAEINFAIWDNWSNKKEYVGLSSQFLWGPSVESTYPFPRVLHLILSSHSVNMDSLLCAKYCNRSWENKLHQSKSLLTKTIF